MKVLETMAALLEKGNIDLVEFAKDSYGVIDKLEDEELKLHLLLTMEIAD